MTRENKIVWAAGLTSFAGVLLICAGIGIAKARAAKVITENNPKDKPRTVKEPVSVKIPTANAEGQRAYTRQNQQNGADRSEQIVAAQQEAPASKSPVKKETKAPMAKPDAAEQVKEYKAGDKIDPAILEKQKEKKNIVLKEIESLKQQLAKLPRTYKGWQEGLPLRNKLNLSKASLFYL